MPTQLLSIGVPFTITQNVVYALPAKPCVITASIACDTSVNGTTWAAFTSGGVNSTGKFIRCTTGNSLVNCGVATAGSGGGGGLSEPLTVSSQGITFIDAAQPADQRRWHIWPMAGGYLNFDIENDAGNLIIRAFYVIRSTGQIVCSQSIQTAVISPTLAIDLSEVPFSSLSGRPFGCIANISDSTVNTIGSTVAGGGSNHILARFNGTIWKVIGV